MKHKIYKIQDTSNCKHYNNGWCLLTECCDDIKYEPCSAMRLFDCYYRQLLCKEQECDNYKHTIEQIENFCLYFKESPELETACNHILNIIQEKRKELDAK